MANAIVTRRVVTVNPVPSSIGFLRFLFIANKPYHTPAEKIIDFLLDLAARKTFNEAATCLTDVLSLSPAFGPQCHTKLFSLRILTPSSKWLATAR